MTGKALVPVINDGGGRWHATLLENRAEHDDRGRGRRVRGGGDPARLLPVPHRPRRAARARSRTSRAGTRSSTRRCSRRSRTGWRSPTSGSPARACACFCCPGNDDQFEVDEVIERRSTSSSAKAGSSTWTASRWRRPAGRTARPWDTYREEDEPDLKARHRQRDRPGDRAGREDRLQLPLPAVPLRARRRARADGRHDAEGRRPRGEAGRLDRRAGGDRGASAGAFGARPHPRGPRQLPHRPNALH